MIVPDLSGSPSPLLFWLLGSVLIYALAANALWLARSLALRPRGRQRHAAQAALLAKTPGWWLWQAGRFLFYLGIPYLALGGWPRRPFQGLLSPGDMGLVGLGGSWTVARWLGAAGTGVGLGAVALALLLLARRHAGSMPPFPSRQWWEILIDVTYVEVHWAFYRAALTLLLGDPYLGVFAGLGLVYVEWAVSPFWRRGWHLTPTTQSAVLNDGLRFGDSREESQAAGQWLRAALALVIAVLFLLTENLWICLVVHCLVELVFYSHNRQKAHTSPAVVG